jgi:hypothetical protein
VRPEAGAARTHRADLHAERRVSATDCTLPKNFALQAFTQGICVESVRRA